MMIWLPTIDDVLLLHWKLIERTGGAHGVRDVGLIESAIARASASFGGVEAYPTVAAKAAALGYGLAQNHGCIDGNKRVGVAALLLVLRRNGVALAYAQEELIELGLRVAQGAMDAAEIEAWILEHRRA